MKLKTAVVLAGGTGLRLRPLTVDAPKAMVPVAGKPILEWILEWLAAEGIKKVVVGVAYQKEKVTRRFGDGSRFGLDVVYSTHTVEGGTAQGFKLAIERYVEDDLFLAMNGDELCDVDLEHLYQYHMKHNPIATVSVSLLRSPFGVVLTDSDGWIVSFREKPVLDSVYVSMGVYLFQREIISYLPPTGDIERTAFVSLANQKKLIAYKHHGLWVTVNTYKDLQDANNILSGRASQSRQSIGNLRG